jgi:hypothetical protein
MYRVSQVMAEVLLYLCKFNKLQCHIDITVYWALWQRNSRRIDIECAKSVPKNCDASFWMPLILKRSGNLTVRHGSSVDGCENSYCCDIVCSGMREANILEDGGNVFLPRNPYVQTRLHGVIPWKTAVWETWSLGNWWWLTYRVAYT